MKRFVCLFILMIFACTAASADGIAVEENGLTLGESSLVYPVITGMEDAGLMQRINETIRTDCAIPDYLNRISMLISGGRLTVGWMGSLKNEVFSCAVRAEGAVASMRPACVWTGTSVDLRDGHRILFEELFTDPEEAEERISRYLEDTVEPELDPNLTVKELLPRPDIFCLTARGLILLYPEDRFCTLTDRAGDVMIGWHVFGELADLTEDGILFRIGADRMTRLTEESPRELADMTADGEIPDIPVRLGDSLKKATDEWHMLTDPDLYEGGRMFALEGARFRNVFLLTDYLSEDWDNSPVRGIRMDDGCLWGLRIGETERDSWLTVLGEPDSTVWFDDDKAEAYRTVCGNSDYYRSGEHLLELHSDPDGILHSIILTE